MSSHRENSYECIFAQDRNEYHFHVRAWNAKEAEEHFRASLHDNGVRDDGTMSIRDRKGAEVLRSDYSFDSR